MSDSAVEYYRRQLDALAKLERAATPAELEFYETVRKESEVGLAEALLAASAPEQPVTPEFVKSRLLRALQFAHQLQRELQEPSLGEHWHRWAAEEIERTQRRVVSLQAELATLDPDNNSVELPEPDDALGKLEDAVNLARIRVEELEMLHGLHAAWMERFQPIDKEGVAAQSRLDELDTQLTEAKHSVTQATAALQKHLADGH